jgi:acyl-CoA reductase-like NAD-dependent aldehyde dehydrogenase
METISATTARPFSDPLAISTLERMRQAQSAWSQTPVRERMRSIRRLRTSLPIMADEFCQAVQEDIHKPAAETIGAELLPIAAACRFLEKRAAGILKPRLISLRDTPIWLFGERDQVVRKPRGLVGIIGTWNYPQFLNGVQIVQALAAGNAVLWKPSEVTPRSAAVLTQWLRGADIGPELASVLPSEREWGAKLAEAPIDYVVFTGHDTTGRKLAARLGERLIPSTLELSGHDAMLVLEDADLDLAARALFFGATVNSGQTCVATRRIFISRKVYELFLEKVKLLFQRDAEARPLAQASQAQHVRQVVQDAVQHGARILLDDNSPETDRFTPILVADVHPDMRINQEALFASVVALLPFEEKREAREGIRRCDYGLGLSIFTANPHAARNWAADLPAGLVTINDVIAPLAHPATPFGGVGRSGWGITQGVEGLLEMTVPQVISSRGGTFRPHFAKPGTSVATSLGVLQAMLRWRHSPTLRQRWKGMLELLRQARSAIKKKP